MKMFKLLSSGRLTVPAVALVGAGMLVSGAHIGRAGTVTGEYVFGIQNLTSGPQTSVSLALSGDQTANLGTYYNSLGGTTSATYNSLANATYVTFGGGNVSQNSLASIGFSWTGSAGPMADGAYWSNGTNTTTAEIPISITSNATGSGEYAVVALESTQTGGADYSYAEFSFTPGTDPTITVTNDPAGPELIPDIGYFISPTQIPLDNLNFGSEPPAGFPGSPFIPLPSLDGTTLQNGNSDSFLLPLPTPASGNLAALGLGLLGLGPLALRRRTLKCSPKRYEFSSVAR